nr:LOW QUALITY PROTEIN: dephospho-CoA kinase-like [Nerophis lumbriciformis]
MTASTRGICGLTLREPRQRVGVRGLPARLVLFFVAGAALLRTDVVGGQRRSGREDDERKGEQPHRRRRVTRVHTKSTSTFDGARRRVVERIPCDPVVKLVGLTGGIGSGKSAVAKMFRALGTTVIDADRIAREVVELGTPGLHAIVKAFGTAILAPDGTLDPAVSAVGSSCDDEARKTLNAIVHPEVGREGIAVVVYDVPLLFENGLDGGMDVVVVVDVSPERQRARILARDDLSIEEVEGRIAAQMPLANKVARADVVIDNNGSLEATEQQVRALYATLAEGVMKDRHVFITELPGIHRPAPRQTFTRRRRATARHGARRVEQT